MVKLGKFDYTIYYYAKTRITISGTCSLEQFTVLSEE